MDSSASQFYTGLIAELYDPLVSEAARADDYVGALDHLGTPALELDRLRVCMTALEVSGDGRTFRQRLRYERFPEAGEPEVVERDWVRRGFSQEQFRALLEAAGFREAAFLSPEGGPARPDAVAFVALALRGSEADRIG